MFGARDLFHVPVIRRYRLRGVLPIAALGALLLMTGCGGGGSPATATPAANPPNIGGLAGLAATATALAQGGASINLTPTTAPAAVAPTIPPTTEPTATRPPVTPTVAGSPTRSVAATTPTSAATVRAANTPTVPFAGGAANSSWTDPQGRIRVNIPTGWKVGTQLEGFFGFDGPSGANLLIIVGAQTGTPSQESDAKRAGLAQNTTTTYTFAPTKDARVGTEQGRSFDFTTVPKSQPSATPQSNSSTIVNHGNTQYEFVFTNIGTHRADIDAFLNSVVFLK